MRYLKIMAKFIIGIALCYLGYALTPIISLDWLSIIGLTVYWIGIDILTKLSGDLYKAWRKPK